MNHRTEEIKDELVARQGEAGGDGRKVIDPQETIYAAARLDSNRAKKNTGLAIIAVLVFYRIISSRWCA